MEDCFNFLMVEIEWNLCSSCRASSILSLSAQSTTKMSPWWRRRLDQIRFKIWSDLVEKTWPDAQRRAGSCSPGCRCSNASREVESCPVHPRPEKETMIRIHYHFPTFLLSSLKLSFNLVITEECKTARFNELKSGRLPSSREPLPGWNLTQVTSNTTVSLILKRLVWPVRRPSPTPKKFFYTPKRLRHMT